MLASGRHRVVILAAVLLFASVLCLTYIWREPILHRLPDSLKQATQSSVNHGFIPGTAADLETQGEGGNEQKPVHHDISDLLTPEQLEASDRNMQIEHNVLKSKMTADGKWFQIDFVDQGAYNPSIIPHPYKADTWITIAQRDKFRLGQEDPSDIWNVELVCELTYSDGNMTCTHSPMILPIASTVSEKCTGDLNYLNRVMGPHDARIFHGPTKPYVMYVSQAKGSCLGQWLHDFRRLFDWSQEAVTNRKQPFFWPTDLQRPPPYGGLEKNWFIFWDSDNQMYMHSNIVPKRVFAKLNADGSVGKDLAPLAEEKDSKCMEAHMPHLEDTGLEWIHQATNSLAITLCRRSDPACVQSDENTFNMFIFQKKTFYWHGVYSPFVMLFKRTAPFEIHGISSKPFWYTGRGLPMGDWTSREGNVGKPMAQSEMVFTTSMSWNSQNLSYHGYLDDEIMISFGMEDRKAGGIDVTAEDLMQDLALCG